MKKIISVLAVLAMLLQYHVTYAEASEKVIYVSPLTGSDNNNGTSEANAYATIEKAMEKVSAYKIVGADKITVVLAEGEYEIDESLTLVGGDDDTSVIYKASGKVILNGAKTIDAADFSLVEDENIKAKLNESVKDNVYVADLSGYFSDFDEYHTGYYGGNTADYYQFYHNDSEKTLARYPNEGYMTGTVVSGSDTELIIPEEKAILWSGAENTVRVNGYMEYDWAYARTYITEIDTENSAIDTYSTGFKVSGRNKFYVFDLLEEIDIPGEWYIDRVNKKLYYYPGNSLSETDKFEISSMKNQMLTLSNLQNITLDGIIFEKTRGYAVYGSGCKEINFTNCTFKNIGRDAINLTGTDITVSNCEFYNMGGRGVALTGGDDDTLTESGNIIEHCYFDGMGKTFKAYNGAVKITGCGNTVINNTMKNATHQMIGYSGTMNKILFNDIERACTDSGDMGAIYSGRSVIKRGNEIAYNYIHNIRSDYSDYHLVAGIYMDDGLCGQYIHHNVIKNAKVGVHLAGGSDNSTHNNIILDSDSAITLSQGSGKEDNSQAIFLEAEEYLADNTLYLEKFPTLNYINSSKTLARGNFIHDNLIVNSGCKLYDGTVSALTFGTGARTNRRYNNLLVDEFADFKDAENEDYAIKEDSKILTDMPQLSLISIEKIGRSGTGGEYSYIPYIEEEIASALDTLDEYIKRGDYSKFTYLDELFAKAEVNGKIIDEYKIHGNFIKYKDKYEKFNELICTSVELPYNYGNIYTSLYNVEGGAGFSGAFYRPDFLENLNWQSAWTDSLTDNILLSHNEYLGEDIKFFMRVPDFSTLPENCVWKNDSTYKANSGEYTVMDVADGYYNTLEILANSDRPTTNAKYMALRLDYSDESHEFYEYRLNYFANGVSVDAITSVESTRTWIGAENVDDLHDESLRPAGTNGKVGHYSVPVDSSKKLISVSILNDKYDWEKDELGGYSVTESEYSGRSNYKRTVCIYSMTLTSNGIQEEKKDVFIPEEFKIYNSEGSETTISELDDGKFTVSGNVRRNINSEECGILYVAFFADNRLKALKSVEISGDTGISEELEITEWGDGERVMKLFIWNNEMTPIYIE